MDGDRTPSGHEKPTRINPLATSVLTALYGGWRRYRSIVWIAVVPLLVGLFVRRSGSDLSRALPVIAGADARWVMAALTIQIGMLTLIAGKYRVIMTRLGVSLSAATLARAHLRRHLVSTLVPVGGPAGLMNFVRDLGRHRIAASTAVYGSFLASVVNEVAFALFLAPVLAWLAIAGRASPAMLTSVAGLFVIIVTGIGSAILVSRVPRIRAALQNHLPARFAEGVADALKHGVKPRDLASAIPYALGVNVCGVAMLTFSLWAVGQHPSLTTILTARVVASVTMLLVPMWQGAGAVELTVAGTLIAGGVPAPAAIAAVAIFRVAQFWFPLALGTVAFVPVPRVSWRTWVRFASLTGAACSAAVAVLLFT